MHALALGLTVVAWLLIGLTYAVIVFINKYDRSVFWLVPEQIHICNVILIAWSVLAPTAQRPDTPLGETRSARSTV